MKIIIKHGKTAVTCRCKECECEFIYTPKDVGYKEVITYFENVDEELMRVCRYVTCPECCAEIEVE